MTNSKSTDRHIVRHTAAGYMVVSKYDGAVVAGPFETPEAADVALSMFSTPDHSTETPEHEERGRFLRES